MCVPAGGVQGRAGRRGAPARPCRDAGRAGGGGQSAGDTEAEESRGPGQATGDVFWALVYRQGLCRSGCSGLQWCRCVGPEPGHDDGDEEGDGEEADGREAATRMEQGLVNLLQGLKEAALAPPPAPLAPQEPTAPPPPHLAHSLKQAGVGCGGRAVEIRGGPEAEAEAEPKAQAAADAEPEAEAEAEADRDGRVAGWYCAGALVLWLRCAVLVLQP
jgi:hypothetical protein